MQETRIIFFPLKEPGTQASINWKPIEGPSESVAARMTPEQIRPAIISWVKSLESRAPSNAPDQVVDVDNGELDSYLKLETLFIGIASKRAVTLWANSSSANS